MSIPMEEEIKRKTALVLEIIQGKTTVAEASRAYDLPPSDIEGWIDDAKKGMDNALRAHPQDVREQYERQLKELQEAYCKAMLELRARRRSFGVSQNRLQPCWARTRNDQDDPSGTAGRRRQRLDQQAVPLVRRATAHGVLPASQEGRTQVAGALRGAGQGTDRGEPLVRVPHGGAPAGLQQEQVQRIVQIKSWQLRQRPVGFRPRIQALPSVAGASNERWATDMRRLWAGRDGWASLALVIDCYTRELLG